MFIGSKEFSRRSVLRFFFGVCFIAHIIYWLSWKQQCWFAAFSIFWITSFDSLPADVLGGSLVTHSFRLFVCHAFISPPRPWGRNECVTNQPQRTSVGRHLMIASVNPQLWPRSRVWWPTTAIRQDDINFLILDWTYFALKIKRKYKTSNYFVFHWTGNRLILLIFKTKQHIFIMKWK